MEIIYSSDFSLINLKINRLSKDSASELTTLSFIDHSWLQIQTALTTTAINTQPRRLIILKDAFFLTNINVKLHDSFNEKQFWNLAGRLEGNVKLVLTVTAAKIKTNWPRHLKPTISEQKLLSRSQLKLYLTKKIVPTLELNALNYLIENFHQAPLQQMKSEVEKINHLFQTKQVVTIPELKEIIVEPINFDIFEMGSSFIAGNLNQFLEAWEKGRTREMNDSQLIGLLAKQLITLRWYFQYRSLNLTDLEIADHLSLNPYYLKHLVANNQQQVEEINDRISYIYSLNKKLLSGIIDKKVIPEYLFLKMFPQRNERKNNGTN